MTIAEVSKIYGLTADTLRYYERIGLIPPVKRSSSGIRDYGDSDCNWVEFIKCMRGVGIPVETLIEYVTMFRQGADTIGARKDLLIEQRQQLADKIVAMQAVLERLDAKIDSYEENCLKYEEENLRK